MTKLLNEDELLTSKQVAKRLNVSNAWCEYHRRVGGGPPFVVVGTRTIRYPLADLNAWINAQRKVNNSQVNPLNGVSYA